MTTPPSQEPCRSGNAAAPQVPTVAQVAANELQQQQQHSRPHLTQRFALGSGPHATLVSQRWNLGQEASLVEILDAALEIADMPLPPLPPLNGPVPKSPASRGRKRRAPGSPRGRE